MPSESGKKSGPPRIWVEKYPLQRAFAAMTDDQKAVVSAGIAKQLPSDYEMFPSEEVKSVLSSVGMEWRDTKVKPKVPIAVPASS